MKRYSAATLVLLFAFSGTAIVHAEDSNASTGKSMKGMDMKGMDMQGMDMKDMDMEKCSQMHSKKMKGMDMKGMDMKDMDAKKCNEMMKEMHKEKSSASGKSHVAEGVVTAVASDGKVTLKHGPVKTLGWPAMTMAFAVKDKALREKLEVGKKVHVTFDKQASDYVITEVK